MTISESIIYRRVAPLLLVCTFVLAIAAVAATYTNGRADAKRTQSQIQTNVENAITNCENANESRRAARTLWNYVIDLSLAGNPDATTQETDYYGAVRDWINKVYEPRDCTDLSRKYPLPPPPPTIPAA